LQQQQANEDLALRRAEAARLREGDDQIAERERSLVAQTKRFGDVMKCLACPLTRGINEFLGYL